MKNLKDMTLDELWQLFPIVLVPNNPCWKEWADDEIDQLKRLLSDCSPVIHHIGSTAIPDIKAKPIVDILVEITHNENLSRLRNTMENAGYICMSSSSSRLSFNKGYTSAG
ncbi:GrpB family protein, partial [uncultured Duncaniella sp.]